jgi:hypothetical protein
MKYFFQYIFFLLTNIITVINSNKTIKQKGDININFNINELNNIYNNITITSQNIDININNTKTNLEKGKKKELTTHEKTKSNSLMKNFYPEIFNKICKFNNEEKLKNCIKLLEKFQNFILKNTNFQVFLSLDEKCLNSLMTESQKLMELFGASGKNLEDYGLRKVCENEGHEYYFFKIKLTENFIRGPEITYLLKFLEIRNYSYGACFVNYCKNFFKNFFEMKKNSQFFSYLKKQGIEDLKIMDEPKFFEFSNKFQIQILICFIYLSLRLLISLINFLLSIKKKNNKKKEINLLANIENKNNEDFNEINNDEENSIYNNNNYNKNKYSNKCYKFFNILIKELYNIFSFRHNFLRLIDIEYIFYNEKNMENFSYWNSLILFLISFNIVVSSAIIMPHRDYFNSNSFISFSFVFYKLTIYAIDCYIAVEALIFIYRLMNYIRKNGNEFKVFLKFYLFSLPKIFLFFLIYFTFQLQIENYGQYVDDKYSFYNNFLYKLEKKECYSTNPYIIFNYFDLAYSEDRPDKYVKCFSWVYVNINLFLSFSLFIFIFYFSLRLKKKYFDNFITFIFLCIFFTTHLNFKNFKDTETEYKLSFLQGEILSLKKLHLFSIKYFMGILAGLFFFYSNDVLLNDSYISNKDNHLPFEYIFSFLKFLNKKQTNKINWKKTSQNININIYNNNNNFNTYNTYKNNYNTNIYTNTNTDSIINLPSKKTTLSSKENPNINTNKTQNLNKRKSSIDIIDEKINELRTSIIKTVQVESILTKKLSIKKNLIFMVFSLLSILFLISYGFIRMSINNYYYNGKERLIPIKFYFDLWLLYVFERFLFLFNFLILMITMSSINIDTGNFKVLPKSKFFLIFGRIHTVFFSQVELIVLLFFTINDIQLYFSYQILLFISLGISISLFSMSVIFSFMWELPIKVLLKRIL